MEPLLKVEGLVKKYRKTEAVKGIGFELVEGQIIGLIGPNGAGKTTTMKCIMGLLNKTAGDINIMGLDYTDDKARSMMAYIPESPDLYPMLTVWEHLKFIALAYDLTDWQNRAISILERFDLLDKKNELCKNLSKGMKQKVSISCALLHEPKMFLVDEPMIGLDPKAIRELKNTMVSLKEEGRTILLSTHLLDTAEGLCDGIIVMKKGEIIFNGTLEELKDNMKADENSSLEELFLEVTEDEK
jgi:ABC-type multidrug transport system, ATPase component